MAFVCVNERWWLNDWREEPVKVDSLSAVSGSSFHTASVAVFGRSTSSSSSSSAITTAYSTKQDATIRV